MREYHATLALLAALGVSAGDVRIENAPADSGTERSASAVVSDVDTRRGSGEWDPSLQALPSSVAAGRSGRGQFRLLTYNVAGLPDIVSPSHPAVNCGQMSPILNGYDLTFMQEDFSYHAALAGSARHPFRSEPMRTSTALMPDGLSMFSAFAMGKTRRMRWTRCSGYLSGASDCLADKGFSFVEVTLAPGVTIDAYNLHADSGGGPADVEARRANFEQVERFMRARPAARAVLVAGDTNLSATRRGDLAVLEGFLGSTGLTDVCDRIACRDAGIDRVFFRSSAETALSPLAWWKDSRFVDASGNPLSDHPAVGVLMAWQRAPEPSPVIAKTAVP